MPAAPAVTYDTVGTGVRSTDGIITINLTVADHPNRAIVIAGFSAGAASDIGTAQVDAADAVGDWASSESADIGIRTFYYLMPDTGAVQVTCPFNGATLPSYGLAAMVFYNVHQGFVWGTRVIGQGTNPGYELVSIPGYDKGMGVSAFCVSAQTTVGHGPGETDRYDFNNQNSGNWFTGAGATEPRADNLAFNMLGNWGPDNHFLAWGRCLRPAAPGGNKMILVL